MKWIALTVALAIGFALLPAPPAPAAGGPVGPVQGNAIGTPGSPYRYAAFASGPTTVIRRLGPGAAALRIPGEFGIPGVDYTGSMTGLSADGRTLILAQLPTGAAPRTTRLLVLDTPRLRLRTRITLTGWSTVDAISPDGHWLYLIQYAGADITRYAVRAYDLRTHHLLRAPVVDPRERDEAMTGIPISRVMSGGGRWAYTLYDRPSGAPFIHALDTTHRRAVCVDLPSLSNLDFGSAHLSLGPAGTTLYIDAPNATRTSIDTRTFAITAGVVGPVRPRTAPSRPAAPSQRPATRGHAGTPWALVGLLVAVIGGLGAALALRDRRRRGGIRIPEAVAVTDDEGHRVYRIESSVDDHVPAA
jgi:hypothetical protein